MTSLCSPSGFESLPADIFHEIFSYLPEPLTPTHSSCVTNKVRDPYEVHVLDYLKGVGRDFGKSVPPDYLELRLVSRAFNLAIIRIWFQHEFLKIRAYHDPDWERQLMIPFSDDIVDQLFRQGQSLSHIFRRIRFELSACPDSDCEEVPWLEPDNSVSCPEDKDEFFRYLESFPFLMEKQESLQCLWIDLKEKWKSDGFDRCAPQLDLDATDLLRNSLSSLFSPSNAQKFSFLTDLRLVLPCTYDFAVLNSVMSNEATGRLRHLYLEYVDATGPGGHDSYLFCFGPSYEEDEVGDETFPRSNLQKAHPNYDYMSDICKLVARCTNLESLGLHATHYLDLDDLDWKPAGSGLRSIYIHRAIVHFDTLKKLLSAPDEKSSNIVAIKLSQVQLLDHTWKEVITHLCEANALKYCSLVDLNYAHRGKSGHLRKFVEMPGLIHQPIWERSRSQPDLIKLVLHVVDNEGMVGPCLGDAAFSVGFGAPYGKSSPYVSEW